MFNEKETQAVAKEIGFYSSGQCIECKHWEGNGKNHLDDDYCDDCQMVVSIDPEDLTWISDSYQYLQRITGMIILPIPVDAETVIDAVAEYWAYPEREGVYGPFSGWVRG